MANNYRDLHRTNKRYYYELVKDYKKVSNENEEENAVYVVLRFSLDKYGSAHVYDLYKNYSDARERLDREVMFMNDYIYKIRDYDDLGKRQGVRYEVGTYDDKEHTYIYRINRQYVF